MTVAAVNLYSHIRIFKTENILSVVLLAMCDNWSSEMSSFSEKGKGVLKCVCVAAVSQFIE